MRNKLTISLMALLVFYGCQEKDFIDISSDSKTFTATIENSFYEETRTSLDGEGNVLWKKGDQVSIFAGKTINQQYQVTDASEGKKEAEFNKVSDPGFVSGSDINNNGSTTVSIQDNVHTLYATLDYRKGTDDWSEYSFNTEINLADGEFVQFQAREGGNDSFAIVHSEETTFYPSVWCFGEGLIKVSGNIMSLLDRSLQSSSLRKGSVS